MKCVNHPDREAVAFCSECGKPLCEECVAYRDEKGHPYCAQCAISIKAKVYEKNKVEKHPKKNKENKRIGFWIFVIIGIILIGVAGVFYFIGGSSSKVISDNVPVNDTTEIKNVRLFFIGEAIENYHSRYKRYPVSLRALRGSVIDSTLFDKMVDSTVSYSRNVKYGFVLRITGDSTTLGNIAFVKTGPVPLAVIENPQK